MTAEGHWLLERLKSFADDVAIVHPEGEAHAEVTYRELLTASQSSRNELQDFGIGAGDVVALEGGFQRSASAALLALLELKAIIVPLVPEMRAHRDSFLEIAKASYLVEASNGLPLVMTRRRVDETPSSPLYEELRTRQSPGLVIFSSGSSGAPKGIVHDFSRILEKFRVARRKKTTLCFLLFDHIGGIDTLLSTLSSGGKLVALTKREPLAVVDAIERHRVHTLPTSPTFLNLLLIGGATKGRDLSSLKVIAYGTEPMPEGTLERLREAFPDVALVQTYGMSELGVLRSKSKDSGSLWLKFSEDGYRVKVVDGTLWVKADAAMLGYLNAPNLFSEDGWLNTEDAVLVDGEHFRILGRATDLINVGGQKVHPAEVESHLLEMQNVLEVTVYGKPHPMMGQMVAARFTLERPEALSELKLRMHAFCRERLAAFQIPRLIEITEASQLGLRMKKIRHEN